MNYLSVYFENIKELLVKINVLVESISYNNFQDFLKLYNLVSELKLYLVLILGVCNND